MKIFRNKKNGKLYLIEWIGRWIQEYRAIPYNHKTPVYPRKKNVSLDEFTLVAEK